MAPEQSESGSSRWPISRRGFIRGVGVAGAAGLVATEVGVPGAHSEAAVAQSAQRFGRMFGSLPAFCPATDKMRSALLQMGAPDGILDAKDNLAAGPVRLITDPSLSTNNPDHPQHAAGITFFGQFLDHDITFDTSSTLGQTADPQSTTNLRTPSFDLDSVYGGGPAVSAQLYDDADSAKVKVGFGGRFEDLPRDGSGRAIVGDPRNDENVVIAGLHAAFLLFHNRVVDLVRAQQPGISPAAAFAAARRTVTWHYHWLILHEFLPLIVGSALVTDILTNGRQYYLPPVGQAFMPIEFSAAAYRFGHSMVRPSYRANLAGNADGSAFFGFIFDPGQEGVADPADLRGGARAPRRFIGWQTFFDFGDGQVKHNKRIDTHISTALFHLPLGAIATGDPPQALAQRNLLRQMTWSMPTGQDVARTIGAQVLKEQDFTELKQFKADFHARTPLWYYVLKEAELLNDGLRLGPVGGRIVAEVIIGLLQLDPAGYLQQQPAWQPTLPSATPGIWRITDLLRFAQVDPTSRGQ
jgi:Animal haem peroxidase